MHIITTTAPIIYFVPRFAANGDGYTADTTLFTADTTLLTADATGVGAQFDYTITDEQTKTAITGTLTQAVSGNYTEGTIDFVPKEGHFYTIELTTGGNIAYRGKMYCTDQTPADKYTTQSGTYNALAGETSYKTYEQLD